MTDPEEICESDVVVQTESGERYEAIGYCKSGGRARWSVDDVYYYLRRVLSRLMDLLLR